MIYKLQRVGRHLRSQLETFNPISLPIPPELFGMGEWMKHFVNSQSHRTRMLKWSSQNCPMFYHIVSQNQRAERWIECCWTWMFASQHHFGTHQSKEWNLIPNLLCESLLWWCRLPIPSLSLCGLAMRCAFLCIDRGRKCIFGSHTIC